MKNYLDILLNDSQISELIDSQRENYILLQLNLKPTNQNIEKILRITFVLVNYVLNPKFNLKENVEHQKLVEKTYILLASIDIKENQSVFQSIMGIDGIEPETLYYFYLASLGLKNRDTIKIRIDLADFVSTQKQDILNDWKLRILNKTLESFIYLVRKQNGFDDIKKALDCIISLRKEQSEFEQNYLNQNQENEYELALSLVSIYHLSKIVIETADYLLKGYLYKGNLSNIIRQHADLARKFLHNEPRLAALIDLVESNLQTLYNNSIWQNTNGLGDFVKKLCKFKAEEQKIVELLPSQSDALQNRFLDAQSSVTVLQMPTSAGKTLLAEFYILQTKALQKDAKIIYIVPSRALVNQVYYDLKTDLENLDLIIEKTSSVMEIDPSENQLLESEKIDVLVSTPEKLDLLIRRKHPSVENISLIVLDEAHTISNGERGSKLELLMSILKREKPNAKFLLLSPFLGEEGQKNIVDWLAGENSNKVKTPIKIDWKPAEKLTIGIGVNTARVKKNIKFTLTTIPSPYTIIDKEISKEINPEFDLHFMGEKSKVFEFSARHFAKENKTIMYLCEGKKDADNRARDLSKFCETDHTEDDRILVKKFIEEEIGKPTLLSEILDKRIAVHHAGLSDETRLLVEHLIRQKQIKYICATSTIADGVNFPVSTVFFDSFTKGRDKNKQVIYLSTNDFWNIAGRAGRTLVDNFGTIIFPFTGDSNENKARELIRNSSNELASCLIRFLGDYDNILKAFSNNDNSRLRGELISKYDDGLSPLIQYLIHLLLVGKSYYLNEIQDLFKDSLGYHISDDENRKKFLDICQTIYNHLSQQNKSTLSFADKTGFSVPSVLSVMSAKRDNPSIGDLASWETNILFDSHNSQPLAEKIKVIATLKETELGTDSKDAQFNPDLIAKILIQWVKGGKLGHIADLHPYFRNQPDAIQINEFVKQINILRFKASWGLSALEGIVRGKEDEIKDSFIPSYIYFGVDNEKSLLLRMVGVPRSLSFSMAQMIDKDIKKYTYADVRKQIKNLTNSEWETLKPKESKLNGEEWKRITNVLVR